MEPHILRELREAALAVQKKAYAPFSNLKVGAALLTKNGKIYTGCNIENSSFGLTICAERVALFKAISEGEREFTLLYILSNSEEPIPPCGACLQVFFEFAPSLRIISSGKKGSQKTFSIKELLPEGFSLEN